MITGGVVKRTVAGGILGATAGYVADADTAKKLLTHTNLKDKGAEMARATKDKGSEVTKNLLNKHRSSLSNEEKNEVEMNAGEEELSSETEAEHEEPGSSDGYQSLAEENENINKRLGSLERKMDKLSQIIDGNGQGEADSDGSQQKRQCT
ncbi:GvpT/GvpP family gas vesicle accessory protein [Virgibacillus halophilus]|uniref:GvpT/GvpP family gas vesicle accessory protein n=1 Tax=Tigheibacillus halophilus TaxID=361280 RepID=A0ABU5C8X6_9BACI|nr:GvpT/GvpP family gas vesicle accessory protein [Virgibacillus halophilus]